MYKTEVRTFDVSAPLAEKLLKMLNDISFISKSSDASKRKSVRFSLLIAHCFHLQGVKVRSSL
jgi:hypothetical protein